MRVKDAATAAKNFTERGSVAANSYKAGVTGAGGAWHAGAKAAKDNYAQGVQAAISRNAFERGVDDAGPATYEQAATTVGAANFPGGIQRSAPKYQRNVATYLDTLRQTELPLRGPKGSPANLQRVAVVTEALRRKKVGG